MALIKCHECGKDISTEAKTCPACGAKIKKTKKPVGPVGLFFALVFGMVVYAMVSESENDKRDKAQREADEMARGRAKTPEQRAKEKAQSEKVGPAPSGSPAAVSARAINEAGHPCPKVTRAARNSDGSISAACSNGEDYRVFTVNRENVVMRCSAALKLGISGCSAGAASEKTAQPQSALKRMRKDVDKIEGITWYHDISTPSGPDISNIYLYIGQRGSQTWLRLRMQYAADNWLFVRSFVVVADGSKWEGAGPFERDHQSTIWEWYDKTPSAAELQMVRAVAASKSATIRYIGDKYHDDRTVSAQQKQAITNVLDAYVALGGRFD